MKTLAKWLLLFVLALIVLSRYVTVDPKRQDSRAETRNSTPSPSVGDVCLLDSGEDPTCLVARDYDAFKKLLKYCTAKDQAGVTAMLFAGEAYRVKVNTRVKIIESGFMSSEVRVMEGPHEGKLGNVPNEMLRKG